MPSLRSDANRSAISGKVPLVGTPELSLSVFPRPRQYGRRPPQNASVTSAIVTITTRTETSRSPTTPWPSGEASSTCSRSWGCQERKSGRTYWATTSTRTGWAFVTIHTRGRNTIQSPAPPTDQGNVLFIHDASAMPPRSRLLAARDRRAGRYVQP